MLLLNGLWANTMKNTMLNQTQAATGLVLSIRACRFGVLSAFHSSLRCREFNQKSVVLPNTVASIGAASTVIARRLVHSSFTVFRLTPIASANCFCVSPIGTRYSFHRHWRVIVLWYSTLASPVVLVIQTDISGLTTFACPGKHQPSLLVNVDRILLSQVPVNY